MRTTSVNSEDKSAIVQIVDWFLFIVVVLAYLSRSLIKITKTGWSVRSFSLDDYLLVAAVVSSFAQSLAVNFQVSSGFGRPFNLLDASQISGAERAGYAADLFYIASLCLAKLSVVAFFDSVTPVDAHKRFGKILGAVILVWAVSAAFAIAFQCALPRPWASYQGRCYDIRSFWFYLEVSNAVSEVALILFPFWIVVKLQASLRRKAAMALPFAYRSLVIPACIAKLVLLTTLAPRSAANTTFAGWKISIATQTIQSLNITAVCALYLKTILESFHSGFLDGANLQRQGQTHLYAAGSQHSRTRLTDASSQPGIVSSGSAQSTKAPGETIVLGELKAEPTAVGLAT